MSDEQPKAGLSRRAFLQGCNFLVGCQKLVVAVPGFVAVGAFDSGVVGAVQLAAAAPRLAAGGRSFARAGIPVHHAVPHHTPAPLGNSSAVPSSR